MMRAHHDRKAYSIHAAVCILTRNRPRMLSEALGSLARVRVPDRTIVTIIVIENDDEPRCQQAVEDFESQTKFSFIYKIENQIGIPFARNRAVRAALREGADVVLFFDDDERVADDWLEQMLERYRASDLQMIGGPVVPTQLESEVGFVSRLLWRGVRARFARRAKRAEQLHQIGEDYKISLVTNNWLAERAVFQKYGVYFDESYAETGGSDTKFFFDAKDQGVKTGWAPSAIVFEEVPPERITLAYVFNRGCDQRRTSVFRKIRRSGRLKTSARAIPEVMYRAMVLLLGPLLVVATGGLHLASYVRSVGALYGLITGLFGVRSSLYVETTGQ